MKKTKAIIIISAVLALNAVTVLANDATENESQPKRKLASERNGDINTPYTPAYLEKIDSNDRDADPEYVEESKNDRSKRLKD